MSDFCWDHDLKPSVLQRHLKKRRSGQVESREVKRLVPVALVGTKRHGDAPRECALEVVLPRGRRIEVRADFGSGTLERLLTVLEIGTEVEELRRKLEGKAPWTKWPYSRLGFSQSAHSVIVAGMNKVVWIPVGFAISILCSEKALAWAQEGHAAVAAIAEHLISQTTRIKVQELLAKGGDKDLISIASWADQVIIAAHDEGPLRGNQEAIEFNQKFPKSGMWHFVNLPLGATSYDQVRSFLTPNDVIHAISRCIQVLESSTPEPDTFTKVQALRLLVHFVGDIHQPLHCGTGFYSFPERDTPQLIIAPAEASDKPNDRGGNLLFYGSNATEQLHALWDRVLVEEIDSSIDYRVLAEFLAKNSLPKEMVKTPGDYHNWAEVWAIESVRIAALAYRGIIFGMPEFDTSEHLARINITLPTNYIENNKGYAAQQLALAGVRLAQLLDSLDWR